MTGVAGITPERLIRFGAIPFLLLTAAPVVFGFPPEPTLQLYAQYPVLAYLGKCLLLLLFPLSAALFARLDSSTVPKKFLVYCGFLFVAFLLTDIHYYTVDWSPQRFAWQADQYVKILAGQYTPRHQYRFLPQGALWWFVAITGDFTFGYFAYRLFFTFVLCVCLYRFGRIYLPHHSASMVVLVYACFYPLSTRYYFGNILDPMFHAIFFLALAYCQKGKFWCVFLLLAVGLFVKETVILAAPCYWLLQIESPRTRTLSALLKVGGLMAWCLLLFAVCRMPFGFHWDNETLNGVPQLMIWSNWGFERGIAVSTVPIWIRHLHPLLFIFLWLPFILLYRKHLPLSLFYTALYVSAAIYGTNLCFGWNYESRNFVPALGVLMVCMSIIFSGRCASGESATSPPT